jgi:hypothetical protein
MTKTTPDLAGRAQATGRWLWEWVKSILIALVVWLFTVLVTSGTSSENQRTSS